jgi:hypothetical protein
MSSDLMTSTMKSDPGTPLMRDCASSAGISVSAMATFSEGGSAEGTSGAASSAAFAIGGVSAVAAPAATAPVRNLRRPESFAMGISSQPNVRQIECRFNPFANFGRVDNPLVVARRYR